MLNMKFLVFSCLLAPLAAFAQGQNLNPITPVSVEPNSIYDDSSASTTNVTCASSLERMNATSFGDVQRWPFIGTFTIQLFNFMASSLIRTRRRNSCDRCQRIKLPDLRVVLEYNFRGQFRTRHCNQPRGRVFPNFAVCLQRLDERDSG